MSLMPRLYDVKIQLPKWNARQKNQYIEWVVVLAKNAGAAQKRYQKYLDEIEAVNQTTKANERPKILEVLEFDGWYVSRGTWKV